MAAAVHTLYRSGVWMVEVQGEATTRCSSKAEAIASGYARALRLGADHLIHNQDGSVAEHCSHGELVASTDAGRPPAPTPRRRR